MASSTPQATSPPPSRPASPSNCAEDQRNDEVAGDESAPLLRSDASVAATPLTPRPLQLLIAAALLSSILSLAFLIVTAVLTSIRPYGWSGSWRTSEALSAVVVPVCSYVMRPFPNR